MKLDPLYQNKTYFPDDVFGLIRNSPYRLIMGKGIFSFINKIEQKCQDYSDILINYPEIKCEYLEEVYNLHKVLSTRNDKLVSELFESTWRGELIAALILLFYPNSKYENKLSGCIKDHPKNKVFELAAEALVSGSGEVLQKVESIKNHLEKIVKDPFFLRENIKEVDGEKFIKEKETILKTYKEKGLEEARSELFGTLLSDFFVKTFEEIQKRN